MAFHHQGLDRFFDVNAEMVDDGLYGFMVGRIDAFDGLLGLVFACWRDGFGEFNICGIFTIRAEGDEVFSAFCKDMKFGRG